jgi:orotate phosphoribosyltransferase
VNLRSLAEEIDSACRLSGVFTLRSGQQATEYFDKYLFESDPRLIRRVVDAMVPLLPQKTELIGGLELGGVPLAAVLAQVTGLPTVFIRKEAKTYGTCRLAEGAEVKGRYVTLIEDVITTGGAVRNAATALRELGSTVEVVICAIDRSSDDANSLHEVGLETRSVLTRVDLDGQRA